MNDKFWLKYAVRTDRRRDDDDDDDNASAVIGGW